MAYFRCTTGGSGKGNTLVVTCADDLAGATITCTNGTKTYNKTCPSTTPYEVTFYGLEAGTWTVSATVSGNTYTTTVVVTDYEAELGGFNWHTWVDASRTLDSSDYASLSEVLADEEALRQLFLVHDCVDYMAEATSANADIETIIGTDLAAKWINLSDYALDTLYANTVIKGYMDSADKYFYGEWVNNNGTWQPKGNVPIMTANNAPYGEAIASSYASGYEAYKAFANVGNQYWLPSANAANNNLVYKFANPVNVKKVAAQFLNVTTGSATTARTITVIAANSINDTFVELGTFTVGGKANENREFISKDIDNDAYYLYYGIRCATALHLENNYILTGMLQFYGRELSVSVPKMTGNTTPFGEVGASGDNSNAYRVFDGIDTVQSAWSSDNNATNNRLYYKFTSLTCVKRLEMHYIYAESLGDLSFKVQVSDDGSNWLDIPSSDFTISFVDTALKKISLNIDANSYHLYWAIFTEDKLFVSGSGQIYITSLQFYGLDYSEKEFEEGTTKKWLYDHGVELETIVESKGSSGSPSITKNESSIELKAGSVSNSYAAIGVTIDLTDYSIARAKVGKIFTVGSTQHTHLQVYSSSAMSGSAIASNAMVANLPNNNSLDVSNINQSEFLCVNAESLLNGTSEITEFWLE